MFCWIFLTSLYILYINPLWNTYFAKIFSHSNVFLCDFVECLLCRSFLALCNPVSLFLLLLTEIPRSYPSRFTSSSVLYGFPYFGSSNLMNLTLRFRSLIYCELIFCVWYKVGSCSILLLMEIQFSQHNLLMLVSMILASL